MYFEAFQELFVFLFKLLIDQQKGLLSIQIYQFSKHLHDFSPESLLLDRHHRLWRQVFSCELVKFDVDPVENPID